MRLLNLVALAAAPLALAYTVAIKSTDGFSEVCSGMYGGKDAYIEVIFDTPASEGQVALVIYEWADASHLGARPAGTDEDSEVWVPKTYVCTTAAVRKGLCKLADIGSFISDLPAGSNSSIYTTPLRFTTSGSTRRAAQDDVTDPLGDVSPNSSGDTVVDGGRKVEADVAADEPSSTIPAAEDEASVPVYGSPIHYAAPKTGYYCVGVVAITTRPSGSQVRQTDVHAKYSGSVLFRNQFKGELPAAEYPKIALYGVLTIVYVVLASLWSFLCIKHYQELLPMQYYITGTIGFLIIEMLALFAYYGYINKHGNGAGSVAFLIVISIMNAARNSLSFFLLLIVAMGLSVVTPSLGPVMVRVFILTGLHFVFGVAYAVGTVKVNIDSASIILVMGLIIPLAVTLTAFLMWIIISLNGTILHLQERKQHFKLQMFQRLWRILIVAVIAVGAFFILSSISLSNRLDEDYAPNNWRWRWLLLDASLAIIYLLAFSAVAWLWRPTDNNVRFAMSQELAQDEADAEDYEIDSLEPRNTHISADPLGLEPDEGRIALHGERSEYDHVGGRGRRGGRDSLDDESDDENERKGFLSKGTKPATGGAGGGGTSGASHQPLGGRPGGVHDDDVVFTMGDDSEDEHDNLYTSRRSSGSKSKAD